MRPYKIEKLELTMKDGRIIPVLVDSEEEITEDVEELRKRLIKWYYSVMKDAPVDVKIIMK